jgi:hypothetical protein
VHLGVAIKGLGGYHQRFFAQNCVPIGLPERRAPTWPLICFCPALDMGSKYKKGPEEGLLGKVERKIL